MFEGCWVLLCEEDGAGRRRKPLGFLLEAFGPSTSSLKAGKDQSEKLGLLSKKQQQDLRNRWNLCVEGFKVP